MHMTVTSRPGRDLVVPPERTVLLNPGPVNVHPRVRAALGYPDVCHREPESARVMAAARAKSTRLAGGDESYTSVLLAGSGTAALEAAFSSIVPRDGKVLILDNGNYGERLFRIVSVHGIACERLEFGWTNPIYVGAVDAALAADPSITHVGLVHHETSTGMLNPLREIGAVVAKHGRSLAVDAISSLGCEELDMRLDNIDWCVGTANKCVEGLPGVSFVCAPRKALDALAEVPPRTFYLDLHGHYVGQDQRKAPLFTPAMQVLFAFDAALDLALEEGVAGRSARYAALAARIRAGLAERNFRFLLPADQWSNSVTNVFLPDGIEYAELHDCLKDEGFVVYGVQEQLGRVFRVANMGQVDASDVENFFVALDKVLTKLGGEA
jgi:2-aminoethylphosphonate-pyruvate transaminase